MDPASLGLGTASITFNIFHSCVVGFKLLSAARNIGRDAELLVCRLRLEEYRLVLWAEHSGLTDDNLDRRLDEPVVRTALAELSELLGNIEMLKKRYRLDLRDEDVDACPVTPAKPANAALRFLNNDFINREQERILRRGKAELLQNRFHKRLWWAAVDRNGFRELIDDIGFLIQRLFDFLEVTAQEKISQSLHVLNISLLSIIEKVDDIKLATVGTRTAVAPEDSLETVAALRSLQILVSETEPTMTAPSTGVTAHKRLLQSSSAIAGSSSATGFYEGVPVYIERKKYNPAEMREESGVKIAKRVGDLSMFLHAPKAPSFQALHCVGYFRDSLASEFVFIFDRPVNCQERTEPVSLLSLLKSRVLPSLTDRLRLAASLATTVLHLHASGWLHKGLRSQNVLFFKESGNALRALHEPYLAGYEFARQDAPDELSEKPSQTPAQDIYRHPHAQGLVSEAFVKSFDLYGLGIMLLEIAYWRPWETLLRDKCKVRLQDVSATKMREIQQALLDEGTHNTESFPQNLRFRMGDEYAKATLQCLGDFFDQESMARQDYVTTFYDLVVRRLRSCKV